MNERTHNIKKAGTAMKIVVREDGSRHLGCDESSGWVWFAARELETALISRELSYVCAPGQDDKGRIRILELGSGTGWLSLSLALGSAEPLMTATDRTGALPLLWQNVLRNQARHPKQELSVDVQELEWGGPDRLEGQWDLVIGSDLLYLHEHHALILDTLIRHDARLGCVLTWEERKPLEEANFVVLAREAGFVVEPLVLTGTNPATGKPVWLLRMIYSKEATK